nr:hypothetical protein [Gammaproteobacteria bacterium]
MTKRFELLPILESERTPLVRALLDIIEALVQEVQRPRGTERAVERRDYGAQWGEEAPTI